MSQFLRPAIHQMSGYTPGEQPKDGRLLKLNTNESPYPPSPKVAEAIQNIIATDRLRKYPDPIGSEFRQAAGRVLGVDPEAILIGNGSDDILTILTRAFVVEGGLLVSPTPSYTLYRTLADIQGANLETVPFTSDWNLRSPWPLPNANLTFVPNPNSPTGTVLAVETLERLAGELNGPLVIDEAYADFAETNALTLHRLENVVVTRTMSKSYALAGIRFGFGVANPGLIRELIKVKDSYNCDVLSLAAATAAISDQEYLQWVRKRIVATRTRLDSELKRLGFATIPSHANLVWCQREGSDHESIYKALKQRNILVRYMSYAGFGNGLRITVGTDEDIDRLLEELEDLLKQ
ncbi:MAG: histidinol-phosphate transaminase [Gemmataceae bacterium]